MPSDSPVQLHVYGISNCDSCRKARKWLEGRKIPHAFHDFRKDGLEEAELKRWLASPHAGNLVNRRSASWRQLSGEQKQAMESNPLPLLLQIPTLIKRPVFTDGETVLNVGFSPDALEDYI